jgi:hypothetical protein
VVKAPKKTEKQRASDRAMRVKDIRRRNKLRGRRLLFGMDD